MPGSPPISTTAPGTTLPPALPNPRVAAQAGASRVRNDCRVHPRADKHLGKLTRPADAGFQVIPVLRPEVFNGGSKLRAPGRQRQRNTDRKPVVLKPGS